MMNLNPLPNVTAPSVASRLLEAERMLEQGDKQACCAFLRHLVSLAPHDPEPAGLLASVLMPGPKYHAVLRLLHETIRPESYLEIGVYKGETLALATTATRIVGVDPTDAALGQLPLGNVAVYRMTSDEFFSSRRVVEVFDHESVDLIFIDGMHWYEYALRDFAHAERWAAKDSVIIMHDCLPIMEATATRDRKTSFWTGDTWKALEALIQYRPDLRIEVVPTSPSGLVVIRNLDPCSSLLTEKHAEIVARYEKLQYPYEYGTSPSHYRLVENSDEAIRRAFAD